MKLVNGKTLRDYPRNLTLNYRIKGIKTFDEAVLLRKRLEIFLRVCDAVAYAHHRNEVMIGLMAILFEFTVITAYAI